MNQPTFYEHTLYFPTIDRANIAECMILPKFTALMDLLGREVNEDDGPCLQFQTKEPLEEHLRLLINRELDSDVTASYNVPFSHEQYQPHTTVRVVRNITDDRIKIGKVGVVLDRSCSAYGVLFQDDFYYFYHSELQPCTANACKLLWKNIYRSIRKEGYRYGYYGRNIAIIGHVTWPASFQGMLKIYQWLQEQEDACESDRIEAHTSFWEERKAIEADYTIQEW